MAGFKFRYCPNCHKTTTQSIQIYRDGMVVIECLECGNREPSNKEHNYRVAERVFSGEAGVADKQV